MDIVVQESIEFNKWLKEKPNFKGFTLSEKKFIMEMLDLFAEYPSFKKQIAGVGTKTNAFALLEQYIKEKNK